ncbi:hypothetical protein QAD02_022890 [Eretmocerus hayati]|uniref:Uncharacterized protein n=1 Tax=Eretmocerus hayati TaxID=131215 RepID=A0ACC2PU89_9HYME|nr:hypothetical protein QAD02_022890 [Eretmocerus hayati]
MKKFRSSLLFMVLLTTYSSPCNCYRLENVLNPDKNSSFQTTTYDTWSLENDDDLSHAQGTNQLSVEENDSFENQKQQLYPTNQSFMPLETSEEIASPKGNYLDDLDDWLKNDDKSCINCNKSDRIQEPEGEDLVTLDLDEGLDFPFLPENDTGTQQQQSLQLTRYLVERLPESVIPPVQKPNTDEDKYFEDSEEDGNKYPLFDFDAPSLCGTHRVFSDGECRSII